MLKDLLARLRSTPVIKQALGRTTEPDPKALYDALMGFLKSDTEFQTFVNARRINWLSVSLGNDGEKPFNPDLAEYYRDTAKEVTAQLSRAASGRLTADSRKQVVNWCNSNGHRHLDSETISELSVMEGIRPSEPITLYRGLLFQKWQMENPRWNNDTEDHPKSAKMFIDALKHGHSEMRLGFLKPQSWSDSIDIANRFAVSKAAHSQYSAMLNWLEAGKEKTAIQGQLGIVLSTVFQPSDIVCDVSALNIGHLNHGNEKEYIIKPGHYTVKMDRIYTRGGIILPDQFIAAMEKQNAK